MRKNLVKRQFIKPFVKWAGGKSSIIDLILHESPAVTGEYPYEQYIEPFLGAGAMLLYLQPERAIVADSNERLLNTWNQVRLNVEKIIEYLEVYEDRLHNEGGFLFTDVKNTFNDNLDKEHCKVIEAAQFIFLNKTCFNGLWRVNQSDLFNVPFNNRKTFLDQNAIDNLKKVSEYLKSADIEFLTDYNLAFGEKDDGSEDKLLKFAYIDPPYAPVTRTANFVSYSKDGFSQRDQIMLLLNLNFWAKPRHKSHKFLMSNSAGGGVGDQCRYLGYKVREIEAPRRINSVSTKRGNVKEIVVTNF